MKFNNLGIFQSIKVRIYADISLPISLQLNFTPSILGCYGLRVKTKGSILRCAQVAESPTVALLVK